MITGVFRGGGTKGDALPNGITEAKNVKKVFGRQNSRFYLVVLEKRLHFVLEVKLGKIFTFKGSFFLYRYGTAQKRSSLHFL